MPQIPPKDKTRIESWNLSSKASVRLQLKTSKDERSDSLAQFCDQLMKIAPRVSVQKATGEDDQNPQIKIAANIHYSAVPMGAELELFLKALNGLNAFADRLPEELRNRVAAIDVPAPVKIYIAPSCPHCPATVSDVMALAAVNANIQLSVIDAMLFEDSAQTDQIKATPTTMIDDLFRWTGMVQLEELVTALHERDPTQLSATVLRQMLEDGRAETVADMMVAQGCIFPAYMELLTHDKWPVRLAAMVVCEYLAEGDAALAADVAETLWARFDAVDDPIKGDILHVLGETRHPLTVSRLRTVVTGTYPTVVKDIAAEILSDLNE